MENKTRKWFRLPVFLWVVGVIFLVVAGIFLHNWLERIPPVVAQVRNMQDTYVVIHAPHDQSHWPADAAVPVKVSIHSSEPVEALEFYAGDRLVSTLEKTDGMVAPAFDFQWQPLASGEVLLNARAIMADGKAVLSSPIKVTIGPPVGALLQLETTRSETIDSLTKQYAITADALQDANPDTDFDQKLPAGSSLKIPIQLTDWHLQPIASALPDLQQSTPVAEKQQSSSDMQPSNFLDNLQFFILKKIDPNPNLPDAPGLVTQVEDCNVILQIQDLSDNEEGFILYRIPLPATTENYIKKLPANPDIESATYLDELWPGGSFRYSAAAYNASGENRSQPLQIFLPDDCAPGAPEISSPASGLPYEAEVTSGSMDIIDNWVYFKQPVDLAYLYVGIEGYGWERVPAGNQKFLSGDGNKFNLDEYLDKLITQIPDATLNVDMEVWGWQNGNLIDCGTLHVNVRRTVLRVCSLPNIECQEDLLRSEIVMPKGWLPEASTYHFYWDTAYDEEVDDIIWSVAHKPYNNETKLTEGRIIARSPQANTRHFEFNLAYLYKDGPFDLGDWYYQDFDSNFFDDIYEPPDTPFTLYVRVLLLDKNNNELPMSNTVILHYLTEMEVEPEVIYASNLPSMYHVEFLPNTYIPPVLERRSLWGCIDYYDDIYTRGISLQWFLGISEDQYNSDWENCDNPVYPYCFGMEKPLLIAANTRICPADYSEPSGGIWHDIKELASGIWSGLTSAYDWLVTVFEAAKQNLVEQIASIIPGCGDQCRSLIKSGLEIGFTAITGLPPSLPNYDELMNEGIAYAVVLAAEEIGPMCDEICREALETGIEAVVDQAKNSQPSPGCVSSDEAHARGKEPLCPPIDPRIHWEPSPGSVYSPGVINVKVWREKAVHPHLQGLVDQMLRENQDSYRLSVNVSGYNDTRVGDWFPLCGFKEGLTGENAIGYNDAGSSFRYKRQIDEVLEGPLYQPKALKIPWLEAGESFTIPVAFDPARFWRLNHVYDIGQTQFSIDDFVKECGDDWPFLFYDGLSKMTVTEECLNDQNIWVPCGSIDQFETVNPSAPK